MVVLLLGQVMLVILVLVNDFLLWLFLLELPRCLQRCKTQLHGCCWAGELRDEAVRFAEACVYCVECWR